MKHLFILLIIGSVFSGTSQTSENLVFVSKSKCKKYKRPTVVFISGDYKVVVKRNWLIKKGHIGDLYETKLPINISIDSLITQKDHKLLGALTYLIMNRKSYIEYQNTPISTVSCRRIKSTDRCVRSSWLLYGPSTNTLFSWSKCVGTVSVRFLGT